MGELSLRALSPDNSSEIDRLIELFQAHYGDAFPVPGVYSPVFWQRSHLVSDVSCDSMNVQGDNELSLEDDGSPSSDLITIVAVDGDRFVAHVAVRPDQEMRGAEVLLPAIHPDYRNQLFPIARLFWEKIRGVADEREWQVIYQLGLVCYPLTQLIAAKCFHASETGLVVNSFGRVPAVDVGHTSQYAPHVCGALVFCQSSIGMSKAAFRTLYPPERHVQQIEKLYEPLALRRRSSPVPVDAPRMRVGSASISLRHYVHVQLTEMRMWPSLHPTGASMADAILQLDQNSAEVGNRPLLLIALTDPQCAAACLEAEKLGYIFSGVFPLYGDDDFVMFTRPDVQEMSQLSLYGRSAQELSAYMMRTAHVERLQAANLSQNVLAY